MSLPGAAEDRGGWQARTVLRMGQLWRGIQAAGGWGGPESRRGAAHCVNVTRGPRAACDNADTVAGVPAAGLERPYFW
jgi:hypothetical protein